MDNMSKGKSKSFQKSKAKFLIGIDEVGRGPIAGPVAVGALVFLDKKASKFLFGARDSKKISESKREEWYLKILEAKKMGLIDFKVSFSSNKIIDKKGITFAIKNCLKRSISQLKDNDSKKIMPEKCRVLLDGGLKAPPNFKNQETIIKGDDKELVISLASIVAKVTRDRYMKKISKTYSKYGFEIHKGYGTFSHYKALKNIGISDIHRVSFLKGLVGK